MNDHDTAKLSSDVLHKYLTAKEQIIHTEKISSLGTQSTPSSMYSDESILEIVPKNTRHELKPHWKDNGRVLYQDREITDSNIADLINDQVRSRKIFNPPGWLPFTGQLRI